MRILVLTLLTILISCNSQETKLDRISKLSTFAVQLGAFTHFLNGSNTGDDVCMASVVDKFENLYCAGKTNSSLSGSYATVSDDAFIAKFNRHGELIWISQLNTDSISRFNGGEASLNDECLSIALDQDQNIYCSGSTKSNLGGPGSHSGPGISDAFYVKMNPAGKFLQIKVFGTATGIESCEGITVDSKKDIYCAGYTNRSFGFQADNVTPELAGSASSDIFIGKFSPNGTRLWLRQLGQSFKISSNAGDDKCLSIALSPGEDYVYCAGYSAGNLAAPVLGSKDLVIIRLNTSDGLNLKGHQDGSTSEDMYQGIAIDPAGKVFAAGRVGGAFVFASPGDVDWAIIKFSEDLVDEDKIQIRGPISSDFLDGIKLDPEGNLLLAGYTVGNFVEPGDGFDDILLMKITKTGDIIWKKQFGTVTLIPGSGDPIGNQRARDVSFDLLGNFYMVGTTQTSSAESHANPGGNDVLILRMNSHGEF